METAVAALELTIFSESMVGVQDMFQHNTKTAQHDSMPTRHDTTHHFASLAPLTLRSMVAYLPAPCRFFLFWFGLAQGPVGIPAKTGSVCRQIGGSAPTPTATMCTHPPPSPEVTGLRLRGFEVWACLSSGPGQDYS